MSWRDETGPVPPGLLVPHGGPGGGGWWRCVWCNTAYPSEVPKLGARRLYLVAVRLGLPRPPSCNGYTITRCPWCAGDAASDDERAARGDGIALSGAKRGRKDVAP